MKSIQMKALAVSGLVAALLAAFVSDSVNATENAQQNATFSMPGADFNFPLPQGYCLPQGVYETNAKITAAADRSNLTDLSFFGCDDMGSGGTLSTWGMVKTPFSAVNSTGNTRAELIASFKSVINPEDWAKINDAGGKKGTEGLQGVFGSGVGATLNIKPLQTDSNGAYMGGLVKLTKPDGSDVTFACVASATVVKGRLFYVYLYAPYRGAADIIALLKIVRSATAAFLTANGEATPL